jgi:hypothetical protein
MECKLRPSVHAMDMMTERGISQKETVETINKGAKKLQKNKIVSFYRNIWIVYKKKPCNIFIVTAYRRD